MKSMVSNFLRDPVTKFPRRHTPLRIFNLICNQISTRLLRSSFVWGYPLHLNIESTNTCNLSCPMCSTNQSFSRRKKGKIAFEQFKDIIDTIGKYLYVVGPFNLGEPLLHEDIFKMIAYANQKNITTFLSTNGLLITESIADAIISSGLEKLLISVDAATKETYERLRTGGDFDRLLDNIHLLVQKKKQRRSKTPFIIMQMIVTRGNEHEAEDFKRLSKKLGADTAILSNYWQLNLGTSKEERKSQSLYPQQSRYRDIYQNELRVRNTCRWAWSGSVINWDGTMVPCCFDYNQTYVIGNIFENDFKSLWNNKQYQNLRNEIKKKNSCEISLCRCCPYRSHR